MNDRALDYSYARPGPVPGFDALFYVGSSRPDQGYCDSLRAAGIPFTFIFETDPNRSQQGWQAGQYDAQFTNGRVAERGYGRDEPIAVVVSDGNRYDPSSGADRIASYAEAWATFCEHPLFFYGNRYAVDAALGGAQRVAGARLASRDGGWLPSTWGLDPGRDLLSQEANIPSPVAGTDLNTVLRPYRSSSAPGPQLPDFNSIAAALAAMRGDNAVATTQYLGHEVDVFVHEDGSCVHNSIGAFGVREVVDEVLSRGNNPRVQPSLVVYPRDDGDVLVVVTGRSDGKMRRLAYVPGRQGWYDENGQPWAIGSG